jgi:acyl dehydratase
MTDDFMTETVTHAEAGRGLRKDASFDLVEIPEPFGPVTVTIDQDKLRTFAFAVDDYSSWYFGDSPFGGPIGHPILLANDLLFLFYENYDGNTAEGLQSHERLTFHSPARVGETITVSGAYTEKYEKRGHGYVVLDAEARGEDGRLIIHHHGTEIMRTRAGEVGGASTPSEAPRRVEGIIDETLPVATRARAGLAPRTRVPGVTRRFHQDQLNSFSWLARGYRNVHTDIDSARKSGVGSSSAPPGSRAGNSISATPTPPSREMSSPCTPPSSPTTGRRRSSRSGSTRNRVSAPRSAGLAPASPPTRSARTSFSRDRRRLRNRNRSPTIGLVL